MDLVYDYLNNTWTGDTTSNIANGEDDGSSDESNNIIKRLADDDKRITLIHFFKNFGGTATTFNLKWLNWYVEYFFLRAVHSQLVRLIVFTK